MIKFGFLGLLVLFLGLPFIAFTQGHLNIRLPADFSQFYTDTTIRKTDTTKSTLVEEIKNKKIPKRIISSVSRRQSNDPTKTVKSEDVFMPHEGKIIRKILIRKINFEKQITDTTKRIKNIVTKVSNKLHSDSKEWLIRDNLFFRENRALNPYKLADNERYLRDLDFILDAKFFVLPLAHTEDSVDIVVMTRDVFSIGGSFNPSSPTKTRVKIYDANLFGFGQRLQFNGLLEDDRYPPFGYEFQYTKNSIAGSLINATFGYTQLNTGSSYGNEEEEAFYIRVERPLVSPYTRMAGGLELSRNWSQNFYGLSDSLFRSYRYAVNDVWVGYNIGAYNHIGDRSRHFVAVRVFDQHFLRPPGQSVEEKNPIYNNRTFVLGGLTFFKQNFYTARFIYGFGRTEDIPYGLNTSIYIGWMRQFGYERPYMGLDFGRSFVNSSGQFYNINVRTGTFNNKGLEDATILISASTTSKLINYRRLLIRSTLGGDFTYVHNQRTSLPLDINNNFGLQGFAADSLWGTKRFHAASETVIFTPLQFLGFRFAPFTFGEMAWIAPEHETLFRNKPYFGLGGGIRTRNENLIFGTIELRVIYYPRTAADMSSFNIRLSSNLRVKYSASFVRAPSFVQYN